MSPPFPLVKAIRRNQAPAELEWIAERRQRVCCLRSGVNHPRCAGGVRWAVEYSWKSRARAFDIYQDKIAQVETIKERVRARKSALEMARKMSDLALSGLNNLGPVTDPADLVRLADTAFKIQQSLLGKVDEEKATTVHLHFRNIAEKPKAFEAKTIEGEQS